ncbi:MAG: radical SAM protein [Phycisphaerae bacterium]
MLNRMKGFLRKLTGGRTSGQAGRSRREPQTPPVEPGTPPFCVTPWSNLSIAGSGISTCCSMRKEFRPTFDDIHEGMSLLELFQHRKLVAARKAILNGNAGKVCTLACPKFSDFTHGLSKPGRLAQMYTEDLDQTPEPYRRNIERIEAAINNAEAGEGFYPPSMTVQLGNACNIRCSMCGWVRRDPYKMPPKLQPMIFEGMPYLRRLRLTGGEPAIFPFAKEVVAAAGEHPQLRLAINTNATLLDEDFWYEALTDQFCALRISIDAASPETYHAIRKGGDFDTVMKVTREVASRRRSRQEPEIVWSFVIQQANRHEVVPFAELAVECGVDHVQYQPMVVPRKVSGSEVTEDDEVWRKHEDAVAVLDQVRQAAGVLGAGNLKLTETVSARVSMAHKDLANDGRITVGNVSARTCEES